MGDESGGDDGIRIISQSDLARELSLSRQAIYKAKRNGTLILTEDGMVDLGNETNQEYYIDAQKRFKEREKTRIEEGKPLPAEALEVQRRGGRAFVKRSKKFIKPVESPVNVRAEAATADKKQLERELLIQRRIALEVKTAQARKKLIDRDFVEHFFAQMMSIDNSQLTTLPQKLSAAVAAAFGSSAPEARVKAEEVLQAEIYAVLEFKKRKLTEFLDDIQSEI